MTRSKVRLITIIGTLAIAAIIVVQGYWVLQMWNYKEKEFSQTVKVSLYRVAKQLVELNDDQGKKFYQIANWIEKNIKTKN